MVLGVTDGVISISDEEAREIEEAELGDKVESRLLPLLMVLQLLLLVLVFPSPFNSPRQGAGKVDAMLES